MNQNDFIGQEIRICPHCLMGSVGSDCICLQLRSSVPETDKDKLQLAVKILVEQVKWNQAKRTKLMIERDRLRNGFAALKKKFKEVDIDPYQDWDTGSFGEIIEAALITTEVN